MKIIGINGSPRKNKNTATMLKSALDGAAKQGAETKLVHLYDYKFQGCISCFACKKQSGHGMCAMKDEITPILRELETVDALILSSPIYVGNITGVMRCFLERAIFCNVTYKPEPTTYFPRKIKVGFIYTMGVPEKYLEQYVSVQDLKYMEKTLKRIYSSVESIYASDTYQFDDYSKYDVAFDVEAKERQRRNQYPVDCEKAFQMGTRLAADSYIEKQS